MTMFIIAKLDLVPPIYLLALSQHDTRSSTPEAQQAIIKDTELQQFAHPELSKFSNEHQPYIHLMVYVHVNLMDDIGGILIFMIHNDLK